MLELVRSRFAPLKAPAFRALYVAQLVSLVGSFMQELAKSWLVIELVGKASAMGAILFCQAIPNLIFSSLGGVWADQRGAKRVLMVTQLAFAMTAFSLGVLVHGGHVQLWHLMAFAVLEGSLLAFDMPAFNTVTPQLVPREHFQQALALNAVSFHLARVLGPSIAGVVMGLWGSESVFWVNALSFIGVLFVISRLPLREQSSKGATRLAMREAWDYLFAHPLLRRVVGQFVLLMALVFPLIFTTLRVYIQRRFSLDAQHYGLVFAGPGLGALAGSFCFLMWKPRNPIQALPYGVVGTILTLLALAESASLQLTAILLVAFSFSMFLTISSLLTTVQLQVEDRVRGRISALTGMAFVSLAPVMAVPLGLISDGLGERPLMWGVGIVFAAASAYLAWHNGRSASASQNRNTKQGF